LIRGLLKWLRQTLDRAPWLMALEPEGLRLTAVRGSIHQAEAHWLSA
jgi:hypothetical protein